MAADEGELVNSYCLKTQADVRVRAAEECEERQREMSNSCLGVQESNCLWRCPFEICDHILSVVGQHHGQLSSVVLGIGNGLWSNPDLSIKTDGALQSSKRGIKALWK